jgi:HSP20 family protein
VRPSCSCARRGGQRNDFFKGTFLQPIRFDIGQPEMQIKLDVTRSDGAYTVQAEMPGMKKEDIRVSVDGPMVTIAGEVKTKRKRTRASR